MTHASFDRQNALARTQELVGSINLTELLQAFGIDELTRANGVRLASILKENEEPIFSTFYDRVRRLPGAYKFTNDEIAALKKSQASHWKNLLSGQLDKEYVRNAVIVGDIHQQKGIEPMYYILGYSIVKATLIGIIAKLNILPANKGRLIIALERFISLDMGLAMVGYTGHKLYSHLFAPAYSS